MKLTHSNSSSTLDFNSFLTDKESSRGAGGEKEQEKERDLIQPNEICK